MSTAGSGSRFAEVVAGRRGVSMRVRLSLVALVAGALFALSAGSASAVVVTVNLDGVGTGTVTGGTAANPSGIDCSNTGGGPAGPSCSFNFPPAFPAPMVTLTATGDPGFVLGTWSGDTGGSCGAGAANPCTFTLPFFGTRTTTATFVDAPDPPSAATDPATDVDDDGAMLHGRVDPHGTTVDECFFEYGLTTDYGARVPCDPDAAGIGSGDGDVAVSAPTEPLESGTTYHYRLVASNLGGSGEGDDRTFTTTGQSCPNTDFRLDQGIGTVLLPDCMALEMVSPPDKLGQRARGPWVTADGDRVVFSIQAALAGVPALTTLDSGNPYVAARTSSGWDLAPTVPPGAFKGWHAYGQALSFTPDATSWLQITATAAQFEQGVAQAFRGELGEGFSVLSPLLVPTGEVVQPVRDLYAGTRLAGAAADHSRVYFEAGTTGSGLNPVPTLYLPGDPNTDRNVYIGYVDGSGQPALELLARDRQGKIWGGACGTDLGGAERVQGAVAADGSYVYFSTRPTQPPEAEAASCDPGAHKLRVMRRVETSSGPVINPLFGSECSRVAPACDDTDGEDRFQGASVDGTKVFVMSTRQLANSDTDTGASCSGTFGASAGCDLYLYDSDLPAGERLIQVSAGEAVPGDHPTPGAGANVLQSATAISGDGSHAYFVAQGVLTDDPSPAGVSAAPGQRNLYLYRRDDDHPDGELSFIGALASTDSFALWSGTNGFVNGAYPAPATGTNEQGVEIGGDGHQLVFESHAPLTVDDTDGSMRDVFLYGAHGHTLDRISKAAAGGSDNGPFGAVRPLPGSAVGTDWIEGGRWVSEDADTIVFLTGEGLVPNDVNGARDSYLWHDGRLARLPGTTDESADPGTGSGGRLEGKLAVSRDGSVVAFLSTRPLVARDGDTATDVYVAKVGGGLVQPAIGGQACDGDGCQGPPAPAPAVRTPESSGFAGEGNVEPRLADRPRRCRRVSARAHVLTRRARRLRRIAVRSRAPRQARRVAMRRARRVRRRARVVTRKARECRRSARRGARR